MVSPFAHPLPVWGSIQEYHEERAFHVQWRLAKEAHDRQVNTLKEQNRRLVEQLSAWEKFKGDVRTSTCKLVDGLLCTPHGTCVSGAATSVGCESYRSARSAGNLAPAPTMASGLCNGAPGFSSSGLCNGEHSGHRHYHADHFIVSQDPVRRVPPIQMRALHEPLTSTQCNGDYIKLAPASGHLLQEQTLTDRINTVLHEPALDECIEEVLDWSVKNEESMEQHDSPPKGEEAEVRDHIRRSSFATKSIPLENQRGSCSDEGDGEPPILKWERLANLTLQAWTSNLSIIHPTWLVANNMDAILLNGQIIKQRIRQGLGRKAWRTNHRKTWVNLAKTLTVDMHHAPLAVLKTNYNCGVMAPSCRECIIWDMLSILVCCHDFILSPLQATEIIKPQTYTNVVNWFLATFWTLDIFMSVSTGYYTAEGAQEMRRSKILKRYARSWMPFDIPIAFIDWFLLIVGSDRSTLMRLSKVTRMVRMVRLLRVVKICPKIWDFIGHTCSEAMRTLFSIFQYLVLIVVFNHYIACMLYATWDGLPADTALQNYALAVHWSLSHSTLGAMDLIPSNVFERWFASCILLVSMVLFSTFLSSITSATNHLRALHSRRVTQESMVRKYFFDNNTPRELASRIWNFIWQNDLTRRHRMRTDEVEVFGLLPSSLLVQIKYQTFSPMLNEHPIFQRYNEWEPQAMKSLCSTGIEQKLVRPAEDIYWSLSTGVNRMIFVTAGSIMYQPDDNMPGEYVVKTGMWACEECLWGRHPFLSGTLSGGTIGADLLCIIPSEFQEITRKVAKTVPYFVAYAEAFITTFNRYCADDACTDLLFNDPALMAYLAHKAETVTESLSPGSTSSLKP